jgi:hypothetical protein
MVAARHNLTRRAVLGAAFAVPAIFDGTSVVQPSGARVGRWERALAALRRTEVTKEAFRIRKIVPADRAYEAALAHLTGSAFRAAFDAYSLVEERLNDHESARLAAIQRLLRVPAPDLQALATKLALAIDCEVWELEEGERCLAQVKTDARSLIHGAGDCGLGPLQLRNGEHCLETNRPNFVDSGSPGRFSRSPMREPCFRS